MLKIAELNKPTLYTIVDLDTWTFLEDIELGEEECHDLCDKKNRGYSYIKYSCISLIEKLLI